jgi:tungstate transport system permease protein
MADLLEIILLTIRVSGSALLIASALGVPFGAALGLVDFPGRRIVQVLISTGMALPPVFVGLVVYMLLSRRGPLGGLDWLFEPSAMILAQSLLAFPIAAGLTAAAVRSVPESFVHQIRTLGADVRQERLTVLRQARRGVLAAVLTAFGRIIAEVGAVMLVGGNIDGKTRVLSTAIVLETRQGDFEFALALGLVLLGLALVGNALFLRLERS